MACDEATDPRWLDGTELRSWKRFSGMLLKLHSALDAELQREAGLSFFTYTVLAALSDAPDRTLRMSELALLANGSLSRLSHAVTKIEKRGWVRRHPCPADGRVTLATLTDMGQQELRTIAPRHVESVRRLVLDLLNGEQVEQLGEISARLIGEDGERLRRSIDERGVVDERGSPGAARA